MKKIFAILIALSALSNFSCKEKEEEYTEGGLVFGGIYMLDGQQLVETDGYILELPAKTPSSYGSFRKVFKSSVSEDTRCPDSENTRSKDSP